MSTPAHALSALSIARICLNGWWDFRAGAGATEAPPSAGWAAAGVLVPSWWTKPRDGVRQPGERLFRDQSRTAWTDIPADAEVLFDAYGYPRAWAGERSGWLRRQLIAAPASAGRRRHLIFEGVMPRCAVFLDGRQIAEHRHPTLPFSVDVEDLLRATGNELAVRVLDYERDTRDRTMVPSGNWIPENSGIWQDVWLEERGALRVAEVTVRTSLTHDELSAEYVLANDSPHDTTAAFAVEVVAWARGLDLAAAAALADFAAQRVRVPARGTARVTLRRDLAGLPRWEPHDPRLLVLRARISSPQGGELHGERFGVREVRIAGPDLLFNNRPLHLFSDWGHKMTPHHHTEAWIRQWFAMLRTGNLNHTRLHTHPHPRLVLDLADEEGVLITNEAGMHGSGQGQAGDEPAYWSAAREHLAAFIRRDRNHPSVILWSIENEMRWNFDRTRLTVEELPKLRALCEQLDPTRPAYHEGDSSLWDERDQPLISRHYGKECAGWGWWDRRQPLHAGEMSIYHYAGPNNTCHLAGDAPWRDYDACLAAAAEDTRLIVEAGRTLGVCCFGPWNQCALDLRRNHAAVALTWPDWAAPGAKPLRVAAQSSEFRYWEGGAAFTPGSTFAIQRDAFRPLAVIDPDRRTGWHAGARWRRALHVVNDTSADVCGELRVRLSNARGVLLELRAAIAVAPGQRQEHALQALLPADVEPGIYQYEAELRCGGTVADAWTRRVRLGWRRPRGLPSRVAVFGAGGAQALVKQLGVRAKRVRSLDARSLRGERVLIVEPNAVQAGSTLNHDLAAFCASGGRVLVLDQEVSPFPGLAIEAKPVQTAFRRGARDTLFGDVHDDDLRWWGDGAYPQLDGEHLVARRLYRKDAGAALVLADSGEGTFGHGGLEHAALLAVASGRGVVLGCQFLLADAAARHPAACQLAANALAWLTAWKPVRQTVIIADAAADPVALVRQAKAGATIIVGPLTAVAAKRWSAALTISLRIVADPELFQATPVSSDPLLDGINAEDGCGVERWTYGPAERTDVRIGTHTLDCADLEPLLVTSPRSLLAELFVYDGKSEPLRAHTATRFLGAEAGTSAMVAGRRRIGRGQVLLHQFAPPLDAVGVPVRPRLARLFNRLCANAGAQPVADLLAGACIPTPAKASDGYPVRLHLRRAAVKATARARLVQQAVWSPERMLVRPYLEDGTWTAIDCADGVIVAAPGFNEGWLALVIDSPAVRKNLPTNLGVPNPEALTFCDLAGSGEVEFILNGVAQPLAKLRDGAATVSDLPLEQGNNHLLIRWRPGAPRTLRLRFRDILRRAETQMRFA